MFYILEIKLAFFLHNINRNKIKYNAGEKKVIISIYDLFPRLYR